MKILFPTDFSENSEVAFQYAVDLINKIGGQITLLHIYDSKRMESVVGMGDISDFTTGPSARLQEKVERDMQTSFMNKLNDLAGKYNLGADNYTTIAVKGHIKTGIDETVKSGDYDLIILGTRGENTQKGIFFGGIANHLVTTSSCPVMAIPPNATYQQVRKIVYPTDLVHKEQESLNWISEYAKTHDASLHLVHVDNNVITEKTTSLDELIAEIPYDKVNYEILSGDKVSDILVDLTKDEDVDMISMTTHTTTLLEKMFHSSLTAAVLDKVNIPIIAFSKK